MEIFPLIINNCKTEILPIIVEHLSTLEEKLSFSFPSVNTAQCDWIRNSFIGIATDSSLTLTEEEELTAASTDLDR